MSDAGVVLEGITIQFDLPGSADVLTAVDQVDQRIDGHRFVSIVGPSGCGKSTLLNTVAGLQRPSAGRVLIDGDPIAGPDRRVGLVFQEDSTLPWKTVEANVEFGMKIIGVPKAERVQRCRDMLELVGLKDFAKAYPATLSGGMRQRVALARTLAQQPSVLLMDEPFAALDQQTRLLLGAEVRRIWGQTRQTVLFVTHDMSEALMMSQQVWVMSYRPGHIIDVIDVDLPDEREPGLVATPQFNDLRNRIWGSLEREAMRGFQAESAVA